MSGGSRQYLCRADGPEFLIGTNEWFGNLMGRRNQIAGMADELRNRGGERCAADTAAIVAELDALEARCNEVNAKIDALRDVWKAIEWEESGDTGPDETAAVIAAYEAKQ